MPSRYTRCDRIGINFQFGTSFSIPAIRQGIESGNIRYQKIVLKENERFDILAGKFYGDGTLWWVICAASNCGFALQAPPGTIVNIPTLADVLKVTS